MASSGTVIYTCNARDIIDGALKNILVLGEGQSASGSMFSFCMGKLNRLVKQLQGTNDFSKGLKEWSRKRGYIFLQSGQSSYSLGPSGDHTASSYVSTTTTANAAASAGTLTLASVTGISDGDFIGINLNSGTIFWTTVNGSPAGLVVTLTTVLSGAAAAGARVFAYTTKMRRPLEILTANLRDTNDQDRPLGFMGLYKYESMPNKFATADPIEIYHEGSLTNSTLYLDCEPSDVTKVISTVYLSPIEDFNSSVDTIDYPQSHQRFLEAQLTLDLAVPYGFPVTPEMKMFRDESMAIAQSNYAETSEDYFEPEADGRG